jgi:UDP-N-acetylglucosamine acyltransferase
VSGVEIGADCSIREGVTIHRGSAEGSVTRVGEGCLLMVNSHLGHNVILGRRVILANGVLLAGHVQVGDGAFLSGNVIIHQFTRIGRLAMLAGGSGISKDVLPFCTTASLHTNRIAGLNIIGLRRAGMTSADRLQLKRAYHLVFRQGLALPAARAVMEAEFKDGPVAEWFAFMDGSRRGICTRDLGVAGDSESGAD